MSLQLISSDGTQIDLFPGTKIQFQLVNSAFDSDVLKGSFTYSFPIPATDHNRIHFGSPELMSSEAGYSNSFDGYRLKSGLIEMLCRVKIQSFSPDQYSINLYTTSANVAETLKTTRLNKISYGAAAEVDLDPDNGYLFFLISLPTNELRLYVTSGGTVYYHGIYHGGTLSRNEAIKRLTQRINRTALILPIEWTVSTAYTVGTWVFSGSQLWRCIANTTGDDPVYDGGTHWDLLGLEDDYVTIRNSMAHGNWHYYDVPTDPKDYKVIPINGNYVFSDFPLSGPGFTFMDPSGDDWNWLLTNRDVAHMLLYMHDRSAEDPLTGDIKFFPVRNSEFMMEQGNIQYMNYWRDGGFVNECIGATPPLVQYAMVPMLRFLFIVDKVHSYLDYEIDSDGLLENNFIKSLIVFNNQSAERITSKTYSSGAQLDDRFADVINKEKHVPDISLADFINGFRSFLFFGCWFDTFQKKVKYKPLRDVLTDFDNAIDLTSLVPRFNEIQYSDPDGFTLTYTHDGADAVSSNQIKNDESESVQFISPVNSVGDLPDAIPVNTACLVRDIERYYISSRNDDGSQSWADWGGYLDDLVIDNGKTSIAPKCSTLMNWIGSDGRNEPVSMTIQPHSGSQDYGSGCYVSSSGNVYRAIQDVDAGTSLSNSDYWEEMDPLNHQVPYAGIKRKSSYYNKAQACTLRMLSYAGLVERVDASDEHDVYPLATCDLYKQMGELYPGQYGGSLRWEGEYGLYNQFAKPWIDFLDRAKSTTIEIPFTETLLNQLKPWLLVKIGNQYFVWSNIAVTLPIESGLGKITIHKV